MNLSPLNLFNILSLIESPRALFNRGVKLNARAQMIEEVKANYDRVAGRWDSLDVIPSRVLWNVEPDDIQHLVRAGAKLDQATGRYIVPEEIPLSDDIFKPWFTPVPEDLRDTTPRLTRTRDGHVIEGYVDVDDQLKGGDSTALPIMYAVLPVLGALTALLTAWDLATLALVPFALTIPYLWTISQSEGPAEAFKSALVTFALPMVIALGLGGGLMKGILTGMMLPFAALIVVMAVVFIALGDDDNKTYIGGAWEGFKQAIKWAIFITLSLAVFGILSRALHGTWLASLVTFAPFALACMYPMAYSEREYNKRAKVLGARGLQFNFAKQGGLSNAHVDVKRQQAESAILDTSPLYEIGTALGEATKKEYGYGPDRGSRVCMSSRDACTHFLGFGRTGSRKSSCYMRPRLKDLLRMRDEGAMIGCFIDCGKGALVGDLSGAVDVLIRKGTPYAFFQGLGPREVTDALMSRTIKTSHSDPIWANGARMLVDHACHFLYALVEHEKTMRLVAIDNVRKLSLLQDDLELGLTLGLDDRAKLIEQARLVKEHLDDWTHQATKDREWFWSLNSLERVRQYIDKPRKVDGVWTAGAEICEWVQFLGFEADEERVIKQPGTIHRDIGGGYLDKSIGYIMNDWPALAEEQRSSFMLNVHDRFQPLMRGTSLVDEHGFPWYMLEEGLDITQCLWGKIVGVNLPSKERDGAGRVISALNKQKVYQQVRKRFDRKESEWLADGETPVLLLWDEVQNLVTDDDIEMLPIMRSAWIQGFFCTQGFDSLVNAFGDERKATNFANTFQSFATLGASPETYEYVMKRLGTALITVFKEQTQGIDYAGAVDKYLDSPFNDPEHPSRAALAKIERLGGARFMVGKPRFNSIFTGKSAGESDTEISGKGIRVNIFGNKEIAPIFRIDEFEAHLAGVSGKAIMSINRAGAPRVDLVQLPSVGPDEFRLKEPETTITPRQ
jgi:hypothetical protein